MDPHLYWGSSRTAAFMNVISDYYDALPYTSYAYPDSAPHHLGTMARLFGVLSPDPCHARVLEIGCASGGNLLPFALRYPGSYALGIDLSQRQIDAAILLKAELGLSNAAFIRGDFSEMDLANVGKFDYIVAHGLMSWIPSRLQPLLMELAGRLLSDNGVVFISHNVLPGWNFKQVIRDAMLWHAREAAPGDKADYARSMLGFLKKFAAPGTPMANVVDENIRIISSTSGDYLAHDYLEPDNNPLYFHQVVAMARGAGLDYLAESKIHMMMPEAYGKELADVLEGSFADDRVARQQYLDFALNRSFRQSLFVQTGLTKHGNPSPDGLAELHCQAFFPPKQTGSEDQEFGSEQTRSIRTRSPIIKPALAVLTAAYPGTVPVRHVMDEVRSRVNEPAAAVEDALRQLFLHFAARGMARFWPHAVCLQGASAARPRIDPVVSRLLASSTSHQHVANCWNETVDITPDEGRLFPHMDGSSDVEALAALLDDGSPSTADPTARARQVIRSAASKSLLVA